MKSWTILDAGVDTVIVLTARASLFRRAVWAAAIVVVAAVYSIRFALPWAAAVLAVEGGLFFAARPFRLSAAPTLGMRWRALLAALAAMALACAGQTLFWVMGDPAMRLVATAFVFMLLIHAQIFMSRSTAALVLGSAMPAATLLVELVFFGGYHRFALAAALACAGVGMAYAVAGGFINQRTARALEAARREAEDANAAKSAFLAMMSHELRTPMNGVLGMAQALKMSTLDSRQAEQVDLMIASGEGLITILGDILDISKIEAGRMELDLAPTDIRALCEGVVLLWSNVASAKGVTLQCEIDPEAPPWVLSDPTRLRQVIANLVSNALKFTEQGGVTLAVRRLPDAPAGEARLEVSVSDTGIGLTPVQLQKLFQPFTQAEASTTRRFGGTGLGLSICKNLVELMGGEIGADSRAGAGSTFYVRVTVALAAAPQPAPAPAAAPDISGMRLLVVDDNVTNRLVASAVLGAAGAEVETAVDGLDAIDTLRRHAFDVVLMDIHMPKLDGVGALARLRSGETGDADVRVIALTADAMESETRRLLALGFDAVQPKPIKPVDLISAIVAAAASRGPSKIARAG